MPQQTYRRRAARVLLLDAADRLLLFEGWNEPGRPDRGTCWFTPGGGVENAESLAQTAARELQEETGLRVTAGELGECVATTSGYADLGWAAGIFRDDFFAHRVDAHQVDVSGFQDGERLCIVAHRWWTLGELSETTDTVYPCGLSALVADVIAGRLPAEPVQLPWQHADHRPPGEQPL